MAADASGPGGRVLLDLAKNEVEVEERRRASLEARGLSTVTLSSTLVTLLLALAAFVGGSEHFKLDGGQRTLAVIALVCFVATAACGVGTNVPRHASLIDADNLVETARNRWGEPEDELLKTVLGTKAQDLKRRQADNDVRGLLLLAALVFLAASVLCLSLTVALIVT